MNHLILAPHIDDETIGCYRLLSTEGKDCVVAYPWFNKEEHTELRKEEASKLLAYFNLAGICFLENADHCTRLIQQAEHVWVPNLLDWHPHHRLLSDFGRRHAGHKTRYYSVDMNSPGTAPLSVSDQLAKRKALMLLYPSQATLLANDKYWLFEDSAMNCHKFTVTTVLSVNAQWHTTTVRIDVRSQTPCLDQQKLKLDNVPYDDDPDSDTCQYWMNICESYLFDQLGYTPEVRVTVTTCRGPGVEGRSPTTSSLQHPKF